MAIAFPRGRANSRTSTHQRPLCRRNVYAQLTLGNQKRVDLLTMSKGGRLLKVEVKAKQGATWPNVKGLSASDGFLVFVDFAGKSETDRPDFYVLSANDWRDHALKHIEQYRQRHPDRNPFLDEDCCPVFPEELGANGKPYRGCSVRTNSLERHREAWSKILTACAAVTAQDNTDDDQE